MLVTPELLAKFWAKLPKRGDNECWPWQGYTNVKGYGYLTVKGKTIFAHRLSLRVAKGVPTFLDAKAMHACDNPPCCNPNHLSWGTQQMNSLDARDKRRLSWVKIVPSQAAYIKRLLEAGYKSHTISKWYQVSPKNIRLIRDGLTWANIPPADLVPAARMKLPVCKRCGNDFIESFGDGRAWYTGCKPCSRAGFDDSHVVGRGQQRAEKKWIDRNQVDATPPAAAKQTNKEM